MLPAPRHESMLLDMTSTDAVCVGLTLRLHAFATFYMFCRLLQLTFYIVMEPFLSTHIKVTYTLSLILT